MTTTKGSSTYFTLSGHIYVQNVTDTLIFPHCSMSFMTFTMNNPKEFQGWVFFWPVWCFFFPFLRQAFGTI